MDIAEKQARLVEFLNTKCTSIYSPQVPSVRFISRPGMGATQFIEMARIANEIGIAPSARDLTFFGDRKIERLEDMGVNIDRSRGAQLGGFDRS